MNNLEGANNQPDPNLESSQQAGNEMMGRGSFIQRFGRRLTGLGKEYVAATNPLVRATQTVNGSPLGDNMSYFASDARTRGGGGGGGGGSAAEEEGGISRRAFILGGAAVVDTAAEAAGWYGPIHLAVDAYNALANPKKAPGGVVAPPPTQAPTKGPESTPAATAPATPNTTPSTQPSVEPSASPTPVDTASPTPIDSASPTPVDTATPIPSATATPAPSETPSPTEAPVLTPREQLLKEIQNFQSAQFGGKWKFGQYTVDSKSPYYLRTADYTLKTNDPYLWKAGSNLISTGGIIAEPVSLNQSGLLLLNFEGIALGITQLDDGRIVLIAGLQDGLNQGYTAAFQLSEPGSDFSITETVDSSDSGNGYYGSTAPSSSIYFSPDLLMKKLPRDKYMPLNMEMWLSDDTSSDPVFNEKFNKTGPLRLKIYSLLKGSQKQGVSYKNQKSDGLFINSLPPNDYKGDLPIFWHANIPHVGSGILNK